MSDEEIRPLVEKLDAAQEPPPDFQLPPATDWQIILVPLSERLYYVQPLPFPEWAAGDPDAPVKLYVTYTCERGAEGSPDLLSNFARTLTTMGFVVSLRLDDRVTW